MFSNIGQVIWDGLTYDVLKYVVGALIMSAAAQYILRAVFHRLKERQEIIAFWVGSFVLFFALTYMIGSRSPTPEFEGGIVQALAGTGANDHQTVAVLEVNVINKGHMQSIVKQWKVEATANGSKYVGAFAPMPPKLTFNNIPLNSGGVQPTMVTYDSSDNIVPKSITPVPIGGLLPGILFVVFDNVDQAVFRTGVLFTVTYQDVLSREYSMTIKTTGQSALISLNPALKTEVSCPLPAPKSRMT